MGVSEEDIQNLPLYGISGIGNVLAAIKMAKYYEMEADDVIFTVLTDSSEMYTSRLAEQNEIQGAFDEYAAVRALAGCLHHQSIDGALELTLREASRAQSQVLHLCRAAGQDVRGDQCSVVRQELLEADSCLRRAD